MTRKARFRRKITRDASTIAKTIATTGLFDYRTAR